MNLYISNLFQIRWFQWIKIRTLIDLWKSAEIKISLLIQLIHHIGICKTCVLRRRKNTLKNTSRAVETYVQSTEQRNEQCHLEYQKIATNTQTSNISSIQGVQAFLIKKTSIYFNSNDNRHANPLVRLSESKNSFPDLPKYIAAQKNTFFTIASVEPRGDTKEIFRPPCWR